MEQSSDNSPNVCALCGGIGVRVVRRGTQQFAAECSCRIEKKAALRLRKASIPQRYTHCSLESFDSTFRGADPSLRLALMTTRRFADGYPLETDGRGLLFTGSIGCGKTHLARIIREGSASGAFGDRGSLKTMMGA
ncbi:MAG: hypothetical protein RB191_01675 [Terriglobia bacterium]|nr:hypothetical protein [Terriglobia bacterium]